MNEHEQSRSTVPESIPLPPRGSCHRGHFKTSRVISPHTYGHKQACKCVTWQNVRPCDVVVAPLQCNTAGICVTGGAVFEATDQKHLDEWTNRQAGRSRLVGQETSCLSVLPWLFYKSSDQLIPDPPPTKKNDKKNKNKKTQPATTSIQQQYHISLVNHLWPLCAVTWQLLACVGVKLVYILVTDTNRAGELNVPGEAGSCFRTSCQFTRGVLTSPTD